MAQTSLQTALICGVSGVGYQFPTDSHGKCEICGEALDDDATVASTILARISLCQHLRCKTEQLKMKQLKTEQLKTEQVKAERSKTFCTSAIENIDFDNIASATTTQHTMADLSKASDHASNHAVQHMSCQDSSHHDEHTHSLFTQPHTHAHTHLTHQDAHPHTHSTQHQDTSLPHSPPLAPPRRVDGTRCAPLPSDPQHQMCDSEESGTIMEVPETIRMHSNEVRTPHHSEVSEMLLLTEVDGPHLMHPPHTNTEMVRRERGAAVRGTRCAPPPLAAVPAAPPASVNSSTLVDAGQEGVSPIVATSVATSTGLEGRVTGFQSTQRLETKSLAAVPALESTQLASVKVATVKVATVKASTAPTTHVATTQLQGATTQVEVEASLASTACTARHAQDHAACAPQSSVSAPSAAIEACMQRGPLLPRALPQKAATIAPALPFQSPPPHQKRLEDPSSTSEVSNEVRSNEVRSNEVRSNEVSSKMRAQRRAHTSLPQEDEQKHMKHTSEVPLLDTSASSAPCATIKDKQARQMKKSNTSLSRAPGRPIARPRWCSSRCTSSLSMATVLAVCLIVLCLIVLLCIGCFLWGGPADIAANRLSRPCAISGLSLDSPRDSPHGSLDDSPYDSLDVLLDDSLRDLAHDSPHHSLDDSPYDCPHGTHHVIGISTHTRSISATSAGSRICSHSESTSKQEKEQEKEQEKAHASAHGEADKQDANMIETQESGGGGKMVHDKLHDTLQDALQDTAEKDETVVQAGVEADAPVPVFSLLHLPYPAASIRQDAERTRSADTRSAGSIHSVEDTQKRSEETGDWQALYVVPLPHDALWSVLPLAQDAMRSHHAIVVQPSPVMPLQPSASVRRIMALEPSIHAHQPQDIRGMALEASPDAHQPQETRGTVLVPRDVFSHKHAQEKTTADTRQEHEGTTVDGLALEGTLVQQGMALHALSDTCLPALSTLACMHAHIAGLLGMKYEKATHEIAAQQTAEVAAHANLLATHGVEEEQDAALHVVCWAN